MSRGKSTRLRVLAGLVLSLVVLGGLALNLSARAAAHDALATIERTNGTYPEGGSPIGWRLEAPREPVRNLRLGAPSGDLVSIVDGSAYYSARVEDAEPAVLRGHLLLLRVKLGPEGWMVLDPAFEESHY